MPAVVVVGGTAVAVGYYLFKNKAEAAQSSPGVPSGLADSGVPGVWIKPGVRLTPVTTAFLKKIRPLVDFDLTVTSGQRPPAEQAALMLDGTADIRSLYRGSAGSEIADAASQGVQAVTRIIENQVSRGVYVSQHLTGSALDFRTRDLTPEQLSALKWAGKTLGVDVLDEGDHVHMEELDSVTAMVVQGAKKTLPVVLAVSAGLGIIFIVAAATWPKQSEVSS